MESNTIITCLIEENKHLKEKINNIENELNETKQKLNTYQLNSKKYYQNNKEKIIERVKEYNSLKQAKPVVSSDKKKEYNKIAYQKRKEKLLILMNK
jgi:cellulose biosynthesis protein BcsQ